VDKSFFSPLIRLRLLRVSTAAFDVAERQVVDEGHLAVSVHVTTEMRELV
jgi:hypothetical protein